MSTDRTTIDRTDTRERLRDTIDFLEAIAADGSVLAGVPADDRRRFLEAVSLVYSPDRVERRRMAKIAARKRQASRVQQDERVLAETGIRTLRRRPAAQTPNVFPPPEPERERSQRTAAGLRPCYICKEKYSLIHHFYDQLCPSCAALNLAKRSELADLRGRVALVTGGRVKIGYQAGVKLLRSGADLIVTTRFPRDSAARYSREPDFDEWKHRLEIFGLDLRHTPSVEAFCRDLAATRGRLDFIVNNACQTVRRPMAFYAHMMAGETAQIPLLPGERDGLATEAQLFPPGQLDQDLQQVDLRGRNSWRLLMADVSSVELLEVQLVNAVAPFILNARLKALMLQTPERDKHIVNVSAVEGQFYRSFKTTRHPHTNMAKAALNMMTRTAAADYYSDGIHMNSVDTGWVTDEDPVEIAERKRAEQRFHPPLDSVDGASRILDPIIAGMNTGRHAWGQFLKDYRPSHW